MITKQHLKDKITQLEDENVQLKHEDKSYYRNLAVAFIVLIISFASMVGCIILGHGILTLVFGVIALASYLLVCFTEGNGKEIQKNESKIHTYRDLIVEMD